MNPSDYTISATSHFVKTVKDKGFDGNKIIEAIMNPAEVYPSGSHPGQWRITGNGYCIVAKPEGARLILITAYLDRVVTAVRPDQMDTPEGRRFAKVGRK